MFTANLKGQHTTVDSVLEKYALAHGGKQLLLNTVSAIVESFTTKDGQIFSYHTYYAPSRYRLDCLEQMTSTIYDGNRMVMKFKTITVDFSQHTKNPVSMMDIIHWIWFPLKARLVSYEGLRVINNELCHALRMNRNGWEVMIYINKTSSLLQAIQTWPGTGGDFAFFSEYMKIDGLLVPRIELSRNIHGEVSYKQVISSIKLTIDIDKQIFQIEY